MESTPITREETLERLARIRASLNGKSKSEIEARLNKRIEEEYHQVLEINEKYRQLREEKGGLTLGDMVNRIRELMDVIDDPILFEYVATGAVPGYKEYIWLPGQPNPRWQPGYTRAHEY